jgi:hypothetical protein
MEEKAVPSLADRGNDALVTPGANFYLMDTLGQTHFQRDAINPTKLVFSFWHARWQCMA